MQKLNLNNIPEAPENKDFWVVGTANREGSIDSNSYKKNLAKVGGSLEDMTANMTTEQKMQARKNLGLYHDDMVQVEKTAKYTDEELVSGWAKISDDTPARSDIVGLHNPIDSESTFGIVDIDGGYGVYYENNGPEDISFKVIAEGSDAGIWVSEDFDVDSMSYFSQVEGASKIDEKYLPSHVLELTNVPTDSRTMTQAQLDKMGLTEENIQKICEGQITHFKQTLSSNDAEYNSIYPITVSFAIQDGAYNVFIQNILNAAANRIGMVNNIATTSPGTYEVNIYYRES